MVHTYPKVARWKWPLFVSTMQLSPPAPFVSATLERALLGALAHAFDRPLSASFDATPFGERGWAKPKVVHTSVLSSCQIYFCKSHWQIAFWKDVACAEVTDNTYTP
ncbi:hypothetical protein N7532_004216 [Penicillium argentinense]|uniref:Uncharacterized protein n=1 Tax=Penicillium argentinense TaxID=1131581 RepID=A0A9W9FPJ4_9EURO|nr:uncharacterized protein N7532_004216 [Penicillium argentinense]KAJ5103687.1 hypothetical protein N7532_004216 [Penicillium argentinense]